MAKCGGTLTNTVPVDAIAAPVAHKEAAYVVERLVDLAAHDEHGPNRGSATKDFCRRQRVPYQTQFAFLYDGGDYDGLFRQAGEISNYQSLCR